MNKLKDEANRCLLCKNPRCKNMCPISTPIPDVIKLFKEDKIDEAGKVLFENNPLSAICAVVCPHENQCKGNCIRGIKGEPIEFYEIENYISSRFLESAEFKPNNFLDDRIAVVGSGPAGNVAMDAARTAKRNGAEEVTVFYRKGFEDMTATKAEIEEAKEDGIKFELFKSPLEILEEGVRFIDTKKSIDENGKTITETIEGTEFLHECDSVIIAVSQSPRNNIVANNKGFETDKYGLLLTDESGNTTRQGVFASGDVVTGARTVVEAVNHAKLVAESIDAFCKGN